MGRITTGKSRRAESIGHELPPAVGQAVGQDGPLGYNELLDLLAPKLGPIYYLQRMNEQNEWLEVPRPYNRRYNYPYNNGNTLAVATNCFQGNSDAPL